MYTLAFETDITSQIIVFKDYQQALNKHAKVFVVIDAKMIATLTLSDYFKYIFMTISGKGSGDRIK